LLGPVIKVDFGLPKVRLNRLAKLNPPDP
jgi:hypothetical protein